MQLWRSHQMLCGGKRDHRRTYIPGSCQRCATWSGWLHRRTAGCRCNHTDGDWLHIGQRLSGNGSECTTSVWAGWHQAREQLGHRWRTDSQAALQRSSEEEKVNYMACSRICDKMIINPTLKSLHHLTTTKELCGWWTLPPICKRKGRLRTDRSFEIHTPVYLSCMRRTRQTAGCTTAPRTHTHEHYSQTTRAADETRRTVRRTDETPFGQNVSLKEKTELSGSALEPPRAINARIPRYHYSRKALVPRISFAA